MKLNILILLLCAVHYASSAEFCDVKLYRKPSNSNNKLNASYLIKVNKTDINFNKPWEIALSFSEQITEISITDELSLSTETGIISTNNGGQASSSQLVSNVRVRHVETVNNKKIKIIGNWGNINREQLLRIIVFDIPFVATYPIGSYTDLIKVKFNNRTLCRDTNPCGFSSGSIESNIGTQNIQPEEFPWFATIFRYEPASIEILCSGTLISKQHVLTAAHCNRGLELHKLKIILGRQELFPRNGFEHHNQPFEVKEIIFHPDVWRRVNGTSDADIAVYVLDEKAKIDNYVRPICLNFRFEPPPPNTQGTVIGWGSDKTDTGYSRYIKRIKLPITSIEECNKDDDRLSGLISQRTFCAEFKRKLKPHPGDNGAGFYSTFKLPGDNRIRYHIEGIFSTSFEPPLEDEDSIIQTNTSSHYVIFTDVYSFRIWLRDDIGAFITWRN